MKTIVAATDLSDRSTPALQRAGRIAAGSGADLVVVHCIDDALPQKYRERRMAEAREMLDEQAAALGLKARIVVAAGDVFWEVHRIATEAHAGLIVAGDHRRSAIRDIFRDTTVERLIRVSAVPVLIARGAADANYRHAIVAVESAEGGELIDVLAAFGDAAPTRATVLHAFDAPAAGLMYVAGVARERIEEYYAGVAYEARKRLRGAAAEPPFPVEIEVVDAEPSAAIRDYAAREKCDLVAVSSHARRAVVRGILGSVSSELGRHGSIDVLIAPRVVASAGAVAG